MSDNTGGSAFPRTKYLADDHPIGYEKGMTLRDYFAAQALKISPLNDLSYKAEWAYRMADAMLRAREQ